MNLSQFNRILLQTLILPVIALLGVSAILAWQILHAEDTVRRIQVADRNVAATNEVAAWVAAEEAGIRTYQNTANEIFLQRYEFARAPLQESLQTLRSGIATQNGDVKQIDQLVNAHDAWVNTIAIPMIAMVRSGGQTRDTAINLRGQAYMERIGWIDRRIIAQQEDVRTTFAEHWESEVSHTLEAVVGVALVLGLFIGLFARSRLHLVSAAFQATIEEQQRTQAALLATEKLAVAGRLAASIAHEIHNPLDAVANLLFLLRSSPTPEERDQFLEMAQGELGRVTQISRAMLGMYREARTPVDLNVAEVMESVIVLIEHSMVQKGLRLELAMNRSAITTGFPVELRQVFTNLLTNAADASEPGGRIWITVRPHEHGVEVAVRDEGAGISAADRERLFQPFFTTKGELGTGLGLWVSQGIVHKHGGTITATTSTGKDHGTTMTVHLPHPHGAPATA